MYRTPTAGLAKDCTVGLRCQSGCQCPILILSPYSESLQKTARGSFEKIKNGFFIFWPSDTPCVSRKIGDTVTIAAPPSYSALLWHAVVAASARDAIIVPDAGGVGVPPSSSRG